MPLLENVAVFDEPVQCNVAWAAGFPRAGCSQGQVITGAGHVCRLRGFVLGEAGRNGRKGGHRHPRQRQNKPGTWLSAAWSRGLSCGPRAGKIPAGFCTFSTSMWEHAGEVPPACLSPPGWSGHLGLFAQPRLWDVIARLGKFWGI